MKFHVGQKFTVYHDNGAVFTIHLIKELSKDYYYCHWTIIKHESSFYNEKEGFIEYHAHDMNKWISNKTWVIHIECENKLPEDLFEL